MLPTPYDNELVASRPAYAFLLAVLAIHLTLGSFVQVANPSFGIAFDELFVFAGITLLTVRAMNFRPSAFLAIRPPLALAWPPTLLAAAAGFFAAGALNALNRLLVGPEFAERFDVGRLFEVRSPGEAVLLTVGVAVLAPIGEELLFRGYLMRVLGARYGATGALFATAALFAIVHLNPASIIALFGLGLVFGLLRLWSGSIFPSMLAHAIQNGASTALLFAGYANESPDELPAGDAALLFLVSAPIVVAALAILRRVRRTHARAGVALATVPPDQPIDPVQGHALNLARVAKPLAIGLAAAILAIVLLFVVDGRAASQRLAAKTGSANQAQPTPP